MLDRVIAAVVVDKDNTVMEERDVFEKQGKSRVVVGTEWKAKRLGAMKKEDFLAELILRGISTEVIPENMQREDAHTGRVVKEVDQLKRRVKAARKAAEQSAEATLLKMQMKEVKKNVQRRKGAELR
ncbi:unnamed protein product [Pedinophyceae sp. YPF-701]|nr:unnamed protein product [Pedinophyceae sp. YPF-701]